MRHDRIAEIQARGGVLGRIHSCGKLQHLGCQCQAAPDLRQLLAEQREVIARERKEAEAERVKLLARQQEWEARYAPTLF